MVKDNKNQIEKQKVVVKMNKTIVCLIYKNGENYNDGKINISYINNSDDYNAGSL